MARWEYTFEDWDVSPGHLIGTGSPDSPEAQKEREIRAAETARAEEQAARAAVEASLYAPPFAHDGRVPGGNGWDTGEDCEFDFVVTFADGESVCLAYTTAEVGRRGRYARLVANRVAGIQARWIVDYPKPMLGASAEWKHATG